MVIDAEPNCTDTDADGIPDAIDLDDDNDGIPDTVEGSGDSDGDGIPDYFDLDSDNDGIADIVEAGGTDADGDGLVDSFTDTDNDGLHDPYDGDNGGTAITPTDADGDGLADYLDLDSDNDGIADIVEAGGTDTDGNGTVDVTTDTDGDGFADTHDTDNGGTPIPTTDTDLDGVADYLDLDSDNDGIYDIVEGGDGASDTNGDGVVDNNDTGFADANNNGMADNTESTTAPDSDTDGIADYLELDSDNDGCNDVAEAGYTDANGDGILGAATPTFNANGTVDTTGTSSGGYNTPVDIDGNSVADYTEVGPNNASAETLTACDSLVWNGTTYTTSGTYTYITTNMSGCDSVVTLDLTIVSPVTSNVDTTICFGDSILLAGNYQTVSGSYNDTIVGGAANTCDSIVLTSLTVSPLNIGDTTVLTACDSTIWGGTTYTTTGLYNDTLPSIAGCDSVVTLDLTIVSPVTSNVDTTICFGDSILLAGNYQTVSGSYNDTIVGGAANTCDSIVLTSLTVSPLNIGDTTTLVACDSAEWRGTKYMTSGIYSDTLQSVAGCDSIITLDLTINGSNAADTTVLTACDSTVWNGSTYTTTGIYRDTLQSVVGCDSIIVLDLTIVSPVTSNVDTTICLSLIHI